MPFPDAKYPPKSVDVKSIMDRRDRMLQAFTEIKKHIKTGELMCLDTLLHVKDHDPKEVMRVCAEAFRCIDIWATRWGSEVKHVTQS